MKQRVITAVVLLALLAVVVWQINTPVLVLVIAFLAAVAANEIMRCAKVENTFIRVVATGYAACVPFFASAKALTPWVSQAVWGKVIGAVPGVVYLIALVLVLLLAMLKGYAYTTFEDVAVSIFAGALVPFSFSVFIRLRDMFQIEQFGIYLIFYGLICALATDSGAQLAGMAFGKHKMSPNISPKKTVEGAIGGLIFSLILNAVAMILYNRLADFKMDEFAVTVLLAACLPVSFLGMMGDLSASVLKRNFGVKDFGKIFPGHGGVMDRFDSSMFTLPVTYALALTVFSK
ncbi:MAG: phosphatidate cytidylyltransferase [Clostridium sp.]|nr:phosphatidate cytidylyltransferase [Clostridium sp.]